MAFRVQQIDHVEVFVPDREEGARWLQRVLGLEKDPACLHWAEHELGPLMATTPASLTSQSRINFPVFSSTSTIRNPI